MDGRIVRGIPTAARREGGVQVASAGKRRRMNKQQPWQQGTQNRPPVTWDANTKTFNIILTGIERVPLGGIEAEWKSPITYVARIRPLGGKWSVGFETPLTGCGFTGLKPVTLYEVEVRSKNERGESFPATMKVRTTSKGTVGV